MGVVCCSMSNKLLIVLLSLSQTQGEYVRTVPQKEKDNCHTGLRINLRRQCDAYKTGSPEELAATQEFPTLPDACSEVRWEEANQDNNWGNCMEMSTDAEYRYVTTNSVPDYYFNPYCPIGLGYGYCVPQEVICFFPDLICGEDNGNGTTPYGDVWMPQIHHYKIPLKGNPTRPDRPGDMYDSASFGGEKDMGPALGVAINGINLQGPNDAGDVSIDEAGFQLACGGHVTPPTEIVFEPGFGPGGDPPLYHYHKSPECLAPFRNASLGYAHGARPFDHAQLMAWALDGFGIYSYQDVEGAVPIVDECGGHFGPVDTGEVVYHYHSRPIVPYHLACQGPSLSQCADTQSGTNFCHPGCGADVCVQPGTSEEALREYLATWDNTWLDNYTTKKRALTLIFLARIAQIK